MEEAKGRKKYEKTNLTKDEDPYGKSSNNGKRVQRLSLLSTLLLLSPLVEELRCFSVKSAVVQNPSHETGFMVNIVENFPCIHE